MYCVLVYHCEKLTKMEYSNTYCDFSNYYYHRLT